MAMQGNEQIVERERAPKLIELGKSRKIEFAHRHAVCRHGTNCTTKYGRTQEALQTGNSRRKQDVLHRLTHFVPYGRT